MGADSVLETIREKRDLVSFDAIDETRHLGLPRPGESLTRNSVSTQPRPIADIEAPLRASEEATCVHGPRGRLSRCMTLMQGGLRDIDAGPIS